MTDQTTTTFDIRLGAFTASYHAYETRAPKEYDGFGTLTLQEGGPGATRWVLIRTEHENWQVSRYASGMYTPRKFDAAEQADLTTYIAEQMYKRLTLPVPLSRDAMPAPPAPAADERVARLLRMIEGMVEDRTSILNDQLADPDQHGHDEYLIGDLETQIGHFANLLSEAREIAAGNGRTK